jgi:hypothetical protein
LGGNEKQKVETIKEQKEKKTKKPAAAK